MTEPVELLSIWWARVYVETSKDGSFYLTKRKTKSPVVIVDNRAYLVYKITSQTHEGYSITDLDAAGLTERSIIRTDILLPLSDSDLISKAGDLSLDDARMFMEYVISHPPKRIYHR